MSRPPPRSTYCLSAPLAAAGGNAESLRITTPRRSKLVGDTRTTGITSVWKTGDVLMLSAFDRYSDESRSPLSTTRTDSGADGETVKWNVLSAGIRSAPALTTPLTIGLSSVNCVNVTDALA